MSPNAALLRRHFSSAVGKPTRFCIDLFITSTGAPAPCAPNAKHSRAVPHAARPCPRLLAGLGAGPRPWRPLTERGPPGSSPPPGVRRRCHDNARPAPAASGGCAPESARKAPQPAPAHSASLPPQRRCGAPGPEEGGGAREARPRGGGGRRGGVRGARGGNGPRRLPRQPPPPRWRGGAAAHAAQSAQGASGIGGCASHRPGPAAESLRRLLGHLVVVQSDGVSSSLRPAANHGRHQSFNSANGGMRWASRAGARGSPLPNSKINRQTGGTKKNAGLSDGASTNQGSLFAEPHYHQPMAAAGGRSGGE